MACSSSVPVRNAHVFAAHPHRGNTTLTIQWEFYVLPTKVLDERVPTQKKIALSSLLKLGPTTVGFEGLGDVVPTKLTGG